MTKNTVAAGGESLLAKKRRARKINKVLGEFYPYAHPELDFRNPFELLVATVLSAQTTDVRVNQITPALFARYPGPREMAQAELPDLEAIIQPTGFFRAKARNLVALATRLVDEYDGKVPPSVEELITLAGWVARRPMWCWATRSASRHHGRHALRTSRPALRVDHLG